MARAANIQQRKMDFRRLMWRVRMQAATGCQWQGGSRTRAAVRALSSLAIHLGSSRRCTHIHLMGGRGGVRLLGRQVSRILGVPRSHWKMEGGIHRPFLPTRKEGAVVKMSLKMLAQL